jgi:hypothetical protein
MVSLNPADYISPCEFLPSELGFLCQSVAGVPVWVLLALLAGGVLVVVLLQLVAAYIRVMTPL